MAIVNTSPYLASAGAWNLGNGDGTARYCPEWCVLNVMGWIPGPSLIAGVANIGIGILLMSPKDDARMKKWSGTIIARGVIQVCQLGALLAPVDIACSAIRTYRICRGSATVSPEVP
jgi:hypothetical protein